LVVSSSASNARANLNKYSPQAGAFGDDSSRLNLGVRAEIRTHIYNADNGTFDYFWVGDNLADGAFIQFGYAYEPGNYCSKMHEVNNNGKCDGVLVHLANNDARWQWQYWPNASANDFFYAIGSANSVGANGTWHMFAIVPNQNGWSFLLDNQQVGNISAVPVQSRDAVYVVAEKSTNSPLFGKLGPVEFRNVAYLLGDGWRITDSLTSYHGCGSLTDCGIANPFGAIAVGPNHVVAGSNTKIVENHKLLWTDEYVTLEIDQDPSAVVTVSLLGNVTTFRGGFSIEVPKGMSVHIQLNKVVVPTTGPWYLLDASNDFQGWTGNINSTNTSISILMDADKKISGNWTTDYSNPIHAILMLILVIVSLVIFKLLRSRRNSAITTGD